jgi:hypothetical protein
MPTVVIFMVTPSRFKWLVKPPLWQVRSTAGGGVHPIAYDATLERSAQLAEGGQPGVCALDDPAMATKSVVALNASAGDAVLDARRLRYARHRA